jgi:hypothetical protein
MNYIELKKLINTMKRREYTYAEAYYEIVSLKLFLFDEEIIEILDLEDYPCTKKDLKILGIEY